MNIIERLRYYGEIIPSSEEMMREASDEIEQMRAELAASQAREKILREAVVESKRVQDFAKLVFSGAQDRMLARMEKDLTKALDSALDLQSDDTALRQAIRAAKEEMRDRCAKACENLVTPTRLGGNPGRAWITGTFDCAEAIRALEVE